MFLVVCCVARDVWWCGFVLCFCMRIGVCVCVQPREREAERERASAVGCMTSVFLKDKESTHKSMHICLVVGDRESKRNEERTS